MAVDQVVETQQSGNPTEGESQVEGAQSEQVVGSETDAEQIQQGQEADANAAPKPAPKQAAWVQRRIDDLTRLRREAEERATRAETELAASRSETSNNDDTQQDQPNMTQAEIDRRVAEGVAAHTRQQSFNEACNSVFDAGAKEYKGGEDQLSFKDALAQLGMVGEIPPHFIEAATALDGNGHKVLYHLGTNPELAAEFIGLQPVKLAIRMAALSAELSKPKTQPVSRAPAPVTPINGASKADVDLARASLDDFMEARNRAAPIKR